MSGRRLPRSTSSNNGWIDGALKVKMADSAKRTNKEDGISRKSEKSSMNSLRNLVQNC